MSPALVAGFFNTGITWEAPCLCVCVCVCVHVCLCLHARARVCVTECSNYKICTVVWMLLNAIGALTREMTDQLINYPI